MALLLQTTTANGFPFAVISRGSALVAERITANDHCRRVCTATTANHPLGVCSCSRAVNRNSVGTIQKGFFRQNTKLYV